MTHEQVRRLLERARASSAALVDEVVPGMLRAGEVQRVLQALVRERVSVRDLETILEALAEHAGKTRDTDALTEHVRRALGRQIVAAHLGPDGRLRVATLSPSLEWRLAEAGGQADTRPADAFGVGRRAVRRPRGGGGGARDGRVGYPAGPALLGRGPARPEGPDPRGPAAAGRAQPARDPAESRSNPWARWSRKTRAEELSEVGAWNCEVADHQGWR